jgi:HAD superfamily hydrolase (TIGR01549 family)
MPLVYDGVIFDMDGTLSVSCIDYQLMRNTIDVPVGDLFTVMETWTDGERIKNSMDAILEIEAVAAAKSEAMPGLLELLEYLQKSPAKIGLVTRNTPQSVDAFFNAIGEEWRDVFDILLNREHPHVKPDKRCLIYFSEAWQIPPHKLLMVGDSTEDVECGNAAGTATSLIAGGGNELVEGEIPLPPPGAVPTFSVESLHELLERLQARDTALGWGAYSTGTISIDDEDSLLSSSSASSSSFSSSSEEQDIESDASSTTASASLSSMDFDAAAPGAPPPGLEFLDWLFASGAVEAASCSFPRIDGSRFGVPPDQHPGSKVLHLQCGNGALTKLLFSAGLLVVGADPEPAAATKRGLYTAKVENLTQNGVLDDALAKVGVLDAAVLLGESGTDAGKGLEGQILSIEALTELARVLRPAGSLCLELEVEAGDEVDIMNRLMDLLQPARFELIMCEVLRRNIETGNDRVRFIASLLAV